MSAEERPRATADRPNAEDRRFDLLIVGAGPAGLEAAVEARRHGLVTVVVDEQPAPGGQIYRAVETSPATAALGHSYARGGALVAAFRGSGAIYLPATTVWDVSEAADEPGRGYWVGVESGGEARFLYATRVLLATGAIERPFPIAGWTLPGVMTVGAAQIMLKATGAVPGHRTVLAGTGPLLYLFAVQVLAAGGRVQALLDTTEPGAYARALVHLPRALLAWAGLKDGLAMITALRRGGVGHIRGVRKLRAEGDKRLRAVVFGRGGRRIERLETDLLLLHQGVIPAIQHSVALRLKHAWDPVRLSFAPVVDDWGRSSRTGILLAGDVAGVEGADATRARGRLAALAAAHEVGRIDTATRDRHAKEPLRELARNRRLRPFVDVLFRPADQFRIPEDGATIVCRCEEVTAGELFTAVDGGASGPNQLKSFTRCGMGPCQGRLCGPTVTELVARRRGVSPREVGYYRLRPPVKPISLGAIAAADAPWVAADAPKDRATLPLQDINEPESACVTAGAFAHDRSPTELNALALPRDVASGEPER